MCIWICYLKGDLPVEDPVFVNELLPRMSEVAAFAGYLCRDAQTSQDLVQETMFKAMSNVASYESGTNPRAWLFQICKNTFINSTRRKKFEGTRIEGMVPEVVAEEKDAGAVMGDIHTGAFGDEVMKALMSIPQDCQTAVLLCDIEGYSYDEIAALTKTRPGTVRSRIFRGRKALAGKLSGYAATLGHVTRNTSS
jgi:RNA polymerase sigma-70 factor (ECF subfamily)